MFCNFCGNNIPDNVRQCPNCGERNPAFKPWTPQPEKKSRGGLIAVIVVLAVCLVLVVLLLAGVLLFGFGSALFHADKEISVTEVDDGVLQGNPYQAVYRKYPDYVLPGSDTGYKCYQDIDGMTDQELIIAEQEIYARHGMIDADPDLQAYFDARDWYAIVTENFVLNEWEKANLELIRVYRAKQDGSLYRSGNKFIDGVSSASDYVFRHSSTQLLTTDELENYTEEQLCVARNEILARHGWIFDHELLREYFYSKPWYVPSIPGEEFDYTTLSTIEQSNIALIQFYEDHSGGYVEWSADNPYKEVYDKYRYDDFIFPNSSFYRLNKSDLDGMTEYELTIARNEIYARNGYTFKSHNLMEYFQHRSWYKATTPVGGAVSFSAIELDNINLIQEAETEASKDPDLIYHYNSGTADLGSLDTTLGYSVSCDAFAVKLPNYWRQYAVVDDQAAKIYFYDKVSQDADYPGFMFGFWIWTETEWSYTELPGYRYLGTVTHPGGETFPLIVYYPTDVQFVWENAELYNKMCAEEERIVATLTAHNGWTFTPA